MNLKKPERFCRRMYIRPLLFPLPILLFLFLNLTYASSSEQKRMAALTKQQVDSPISQSVASASSNSLPADSLVVITDHSFTGTNVNLQWSTAAADTAYKLAGYNIYRRAKGETFSTSPQAYTGTDTTYTDSRLQAGQTYYYKITARGFDRSEHDTSTVYTLTAPSGSNGYTSYANLKTAVVIYRHNNDRRGEGEYSMSDSEVQEIKTMLEYGRQLS